MKNLSRLLLLVLLAPLFAACDSGPAEEAPSVGAVLVASGGNFSDQNGFLTRYDPETGQTTHLPDLGGFAQDLELHDGRVYVLINTFSTGRIDVLDEESLSQVAQISPLAAPRDVVFLGDEGWVVNFLFGQNGTAVAFGLDDGVVSDPIPVGETPEAIAALNGRLYVAVNGSLGDGRVVTVLDPDTRAVVRDIETGCDGPRDLYPAGGTTLVVVCTGKTVYNADFSEIIEQTDGQVVFLDASSGEATHRILLDGQAGSTGGTEAAWMSQSTGELFVLMAATHTIAVVNLAARTVQEMISLPPANGLTGLSGIAYDAGRDRIYVGRFPEHAGGGPDFTAGGTVLVLDRTGQRVASFEVGPSPSTIRLASRE